MSDLIAIKFDSDEEAILALRSLRDIEAQGLIAFDDTAVIAKDTEGKVWVKGEVDSGIETGATVGGLLGLLLGPFGVAVGALGGAAVGITLDKGIDDDFVAEVRDALQPDTSALFLMVRQADAAALVSALSPYEGRVFQTTLSAEATEVLNEAMQGTQFDITDNASESMETAELAKAATRSEDV